MELVILIGIISATAAGLACAAEHSYAARHNWSALWRYGAGALTWLVAYAPPLIGAVGMRLLPIAVAVLVYAMAWLVIIGMGVATALCYQAPIALPAEDDLDAKINKALRNN